MRVGIILAAGTARRMGGVSRTELELHGRTLIAHVVGGTRGASFESLVATPPDRESPAGAPRCLEDRRSAGRPRAP